MLRSRTTPAILLTFLSISTGSAQQVQTLPGGASSLQEAYQDWRVTCAVQGKTRACTISQSQNQQNGQRLLGMELRSRSNGGVAGALVLPFGLLLNAGAVLQIDDKAAHEPLGFRTCVPTGCLVPVSFDQAAVSALRTGTALKILLTAEDGRKLTFPVSLKGFAASLDRLNTLTSS